ncbi:hypothetical protein D5S18_33795 [Nocardia panacis]|uniref:DUF8175 domain-containing protein n=1 Tax=Nocardia panacis TaxID=2340916 RepID=A0A3A4JWV3_9NOCA|nr:hypothetical protein [Nocardia panacis]RJO68482.1 hypothetical protein D5S18_33795 [Nocardia panacis]
MNGVATLRNWGAPLMGAALLLTAVGCGGGAESAPRGSDLSGAPTNVTWQQYQGVSLPQADQGPKRTDTGAATGFDRSPQGAALAAIAHTVRLGVATDGEWAKVAARELVPGRAKDEWAITRIQVSIPGPAAPEYVPRLLGYRFTGYTEASGAVDIYTEYPDRSRSVNHATVEWFAEDWRLRLPDPGDTARRLEPVNEIPGDIVKLEAPR